MLGIMPMRARRAWSSGCWFGVSQVLGYVQEDREGNWRDKQ